jgi:hypothetical protein
MLLQQPEHATDHLSLECFALPRLEEATDRIDAPARGVGRLLVRALRLGWRSRLGGGRRGRLLEVAASISRALCESLRVPYLDHSGDAFAAPSTSSDGAIRERGPGSFVCTTGVGTPLSDKIVTAASPMPIDVSSSSRS